MKRTVLVVDDSPYMRRVIKDALDLGGYSVIAEASNGKEAIDMALELQPEVITLDNILPDMVGKDILKEYQKKGLKSKIVMISASGQESTINECQQLGASLYIVKPFTNDKLINGLNEICINER